MAARRVVVSETSLTSTLNDRFRKIQEDSIEKAVDVRRKVTRTASIRSVSLTRPSTRGITKPGTRGRIGRLSRGGIINSDGNGRLARGINRGGRSKLNGTNSRDGNKLKTTTSNRGRGGRGRGRGGRVSRGSRRGRGVRSGRGGNDKKGKDGQNLSKDVLDEELDSYMLKDSKKGKDILDTELEEYMSQRGTQGTNTTTATTNVDEQADHQDE